MCEKYPRLNGAVKRVRKWLVIYETVPLCDFYIDYERVQELTHIAKQVFREKVDKEDILTRMNSSYKAPVHSESEDE